MSRTTKRPVPVGLDSVVSALARRDVFETAAGRLGSILGEHGGVVQDADDEGQQTLLIECPTRFSTSGTYYIQPRVKLESGARSALEPSVVVSVGAFI